MKNFCIKVMSFFMLLALTSITETYNSKDISENSSNSVVLNKKDNEVIDKFKKMFEKKAVICDFIEQHKERGSKTIKEQKGVLLYDIKNKKIRISYDNHMIVVFDESRVNILHDNKDMNIVKAKDTPLQLLLKDLNIHHIKELNQKKYSNQYILTIKDDEYGIQLLYNFDTNEVSMIYLMDYDVLIKLNNFKQIKKYKDNNLFFISSNPDSLSRSYKDRQEIESYLDLYD